MAWEPQPFDEASTPTWLESAWAQETSRKARKLPEWIRPTELGAIIVEQRRLNDAQVLTVLAALRESTLDTPHPLIRQLRKHAEPTSLDTLAWQLFDAWEKAGMPDQHTWAMFALGLLGFDTAAVRLAARVRSWAVENRKKLAYLGLFCLHAMGTDAALMQLDSLSRRSQQGWVQEQAREYLHDIAAARGMTPEDLEDRAIPDCGLNAHGTRAFDLGGRTFHFVLGPALKPMLRDADGKTQASLPRPRKTDDSQLSAQVRAEWDRFKRQVGQVAKLQADRLKKAFALSRRWSPAAFGELSRHPLMRHLLRGLLWGVYDTAHCTPGWGAGRLQFAFRLTEEGDWADQADTTVGIEPGAAALIGLVHPTHLDEFQRGAWGQVLSDYEVIAPFPQFLRTVHPLTDDERSRDELTRFAQEPIPSRLMFAVISNMGWTRLPPQAPPPEGFSKTFGSAGVTAVVNYEPETGHVWDRSCFTRCRFMHAPGVDDEGSGGMLRLGEIDPAIVSEVIRDLTNVIGAARRNAE